MCYFFISLSQSFLHFGSRLLAERYPTEPSQLIDSSGWASPANYMGRIARTSRA